LGIRNGFEALETSYGALESSFEADFSGSRAGSKSGLARPTAGVGPNPRSGVGLARPPAGVGPDPLPRGSGQTHAGSGFGTIAGGLVNSFSRGFFFFFFKRSWDFLLSISHFD
jgi:hypothetical protein